jgi:hypothetical protein
LRRPQETELAFRVVLLKPGLVLLKTTLLAVLASPTHSVGRRAVTLAPLLPASHEARQQEQLGRIDEEQ